MTSNDFDIEANINSGDSRVGLDERGTQEVLEIMRRERVKYVPFLSVVTCSPHSILCLYKLRSS